MSSHAQMSIPKIDYDQTKTTKSKTSIKKEFFKSGKLLLEVFYPVSTDEMDGPCGLSNVVYDSIYFYSAPNVILYNFSKESGNDVLKWTGRLKEYYGYYPSGALRVHSKSIVDPDYFSIDPIRCGSDKFYVGAFTQFNDEGDTSSFMNYSEGMFKNMPSYTNIKKIADLKLKADALLKANLGEDFFAKHIRFNYGKTHIDWDWDLIQSMNPRLKKNDLPPDNAILQVKFSYLIYFSESEQYDLIHIQFDTNGNVVYKTEDKKNSFTDGLLNSKPASIISITEALELAQPIIKNKTEVYIDLIWKEDAVVDGKGAYYYQILFNKTSKSDQYSSTITFDELLIHAETKELLKLQKYTTKIEALGEPMTEDGETITK